MVKLPKKSCWVQQDGAKKVEKTGYRAWASIESATTSGIYGDTEIISRNEAHDLLMGLEDNPITTRMVCISVYDPNRALVYGAVLQRYQNS